eukprot:198409_1
MSSLLAIEKLINVIEKTYKPSNRLIWITGPSGAGKTTLGENFKTRDCIHFDADQVAFGGDPIKDAGNYKELRNNKKKRSKKLVDAWDTATQKGFKALFKNETPDLSVWKPFYEILVPKIKSFASQNPDKMIVITHAVYQRCARDHLRLMFNDEYNLTFIILNTKVELTSSRIISRYDDLAANAGQTVEQYLNAMGSSIEKVKKSAESYRRGFESKHENEYNTYQIDVDENMAKQDVFNKAIQLLHLD